MTKKIKKTESIARWTSYEMDGALTAFISKLEKLITENPSHFDFQMEVEMESGYYDGYSAYLNITATRWETDAELTARISAQNNAAKRAKLKAIEDAKNKEIKERTLYESLKRKFEKEINEGNEELQKLREGVSAKESKG